MKDIFVSGTIERIIFENQNNFFKILLLELDETNADFDDYEIIVTGTMGDIVEGEAYTFWGDLVTHPKYGLQLQLSRYERAKPTAAGLITYFSSDHFKGIGRKTAEKIVSLYGEDPIDQILANPDKLKDISGLSAKNRQAFVETLRQNYGTEQILSQLAQYGIPNKYAFKIHEVYQEKTLEIVQENPYQLVEEVEGLQFALADTIAESLGIAADAPERFRAGLVYGIYRQTIESGDTYVDARDLLDYTLQTLEKARPIALDPAQVAQELGQLLDQGRLQQIDTKIFPNYLYQAESGIAKHLKRILSAEPLETFDEAEIDEAIRHVEKMGNLTYDETQKEAIRKAIQLPVFFLTGGPGTGKTTVINGIIAVYGLLHQINLQKVDESPILLAAPTGRAARRMNELTGLPSATIHRHLGLTEGQSEPSLTDYLEAEFVIVDEFSMVDTQLAYQLFSSIASQTKLLIVGDSDQLPSVGPGQVLADLLQVSQLPSLTLTKIFRQSEDSTIVTLASQIRQGKLPLDTRQKKPDRSYFEAHNEQVPAIIERVISAAVQSGIPAADVQILAPMYRGQAGIDHLNHMTQELLNPLGNNEIEFVQGETRFRSGDRVIHLVNDTEANVFNGDLGYISDLIPAKYTDSNQDELSITFEGSEVTYPRNEWYKITLAYAMSIHKSQGSEFPVVILPLTRSSYRMLQRNLLYTAITRTKSKLILLGEWSAFEQAVQQTGTIRKTGLLLHFGQGTPSDRVPHQASVFVNDTEEPPQPSLQTEEVLPEHSYTTSPSEAPHRLTVHNLDQIDPMIGLTTEDIARFFSTET